MLVRTNHETARGSSWQATDCSSTSGTQAFKCGVNKTMKILHSSAEDSMIPLLTPLLVLIDVVATSDDHCSKCGNTSVPFPLSLDPSCGQIQYKVACNNGRLELPALSGSYSILKINPRSRKIFISSMPFARSSCISLDAFGNPPGGDGSGGLLLDRNQGFNVTSANTLMLLNCSSILLRSPLDCSKNSICHRYVDKVPAARFCRSSDLCCSFTAGGSSTSHRIRANTNGSSCSAYVSVIGLDPSLDPNQWNYGIELEWSTPKEASCSFLGQICATRNSSCKLETTSNSYRCLCDPGFFWDSYSGNCSRVPFSCSGSCVRSSARDRTGLIAGLTSAIAAALIVFLVAIWLQRRSRRLEKQAARVRELTLVMSNSGGKSSKIFTAKEMKRATNDFSKDRLLGSGGFGEVYKGVLDNGVVVAIKAAKLGNIKGRDQVINEVRILSQVNHRNLVRIWGCCVESDGPLVVYEYVPNGTLHEWLHGKSRRFLDWRTRLEIALQTAEGFHSAAYPPIYHRDVKSSNILLDDLMEARVCDFGLSRLAEPDITHVSTCAQGTLGYLDPEYYRKYQLTDKSDVYSFGVVLLEIVTSQKAINFNRDPEEVNLVMYVMARTEKGGILDVVDKMLLNSLKPGSPLTPVTAETLAAVVRLALNCLRESRIERPTMKEVVEELRYIIQTYNDVD